MGTTTTTETLALTAVEETLTTLRMRGASEEELLTHARDLGALIWPKATVQASCFGDREQLDWHLRRVALGQAEPTETEEPERIGMQCLSDGDRAVWVRLSDDEQADYLGDFATFQHYRDTARARRA